MSVTPAGAPKASPEQLAGLVPLGTLSPERLMELAEVAVLERGARGADPLQGYPTAGRSMFLLRETDRSVTDICFDVGFSSLGTFSRTFRGIVGETPSGYRGGHGPMPVPNCVQLASTRPRAAAGDTPRSSSFGEAGAAAAP